jgi:hypothetical protein
MVPHSQHIPYQNIPNGISTSGYVDKLEDFLETHLSSFSYVVSSKESERLITDKIYRNLQRQSRLNDAPFDFQPETIQEADKGHDKSTDIGVNLNTYDIDMELIYCIEAKRLPTDKPNGVREKEYVFGKGGGIERFKTNQHGKNRKGELLGRNGMIGYVQQNDFNHWHLTINNWIENDTNWGSSEILKNKTSNSIGKFESVHARNSGENLYLTHFWIKLC